MADRPSEEPQHLNIIILNTIFIVSKLNIIVKAHVFFDIWENENLELSSNTITTESLSLDGHYDYVTTIFEMDTN